MRSRPPASSIRPLRSCHSWASWRRPPETRPVLFGLLGDERREDSERHEEGAGGGERARARVAEGPGPEPADPLEHPRGAQAAEHAGGRGRHDQVALVAGEAGLGHPGHEHEPGERRRTPATSVRRLAPVAHPHHEGVDEADDDPALTGAITTLRKRLTSSSAGCSANAALPGFGLFARAPARKGSPEPHHSGRNQSAGTSAPSTTRRTRRRGSANHSQSP